MTQNVSVYGCGGTGINIIQKLNMVNNPLDSTRANMVAFMIDTSGANLPKMSKFDNVWLFETNDAGNNQGSGMDRRTNAQVIKNNIPAVLDKFKPGKFNIVISSAAGGSGSVIAPVLVDNLLAKGENVVVVLIGSKESVKGTDNTIKTIQSYSAISNKHDKPIVCMYHENYADVISKDSINDIVVKDIMDLCILFSGNTFAIDEQDVSNFINYDRVTTFPPTIAVLNIVDQKTEFEIGGDCPSIITLCEKGNDKFLEGVTPEFFKEGNVPEGVVRDTLPFSYVVRLGEIDKVVKSLEAETNKHNIIRKQRNHQTSFHDSKNADEDGLVL